MKKQLQELKQEFSNFSTSQNEYVVNDKKYVVISHFVGNKNTNEILIKLAQKQAYDEMFLVISKNSQSNIFCDIIQNVFTFSVLISLKRRTNEIKTRNKSRYICKIIER